MSSNRLAVYMKDRIVVELMAHAFKARRDALEKEKHDLGRAVYADVFPAAILKAVKKLPPNWISTDDVMYVKFGGDFTRVSFGEQRPVPSISRGNAHTIYSATDPMCDRYRAYLLAKKTLDEDESKARKQASATLNSFTTVGALLKGWPEVEPFLQGIIKVPDRLPAVQVDVLNNTFGLPVAKKGKAK
jgi:hypothetical protein